MPGLCRSHICVKFILKELHYYKVRNYILKSLKASIGRTLILVADEQRTYIWHIHIQRRRMQTLRSFILFPPSSLIYLVLYLFSVQFLQKIQIARSRSIILLIYTLLLFFSSISRSIFNPKPLMLSVVKNLHFHRDDQGLVVALLVRDLISGCECVSTPKKKKKPNWNQSLQMTNEMTFTGNKIGLRSLTF